MGLESHFPTSNRQLFLLTVVNGLLGNAFPTKRFDHLTSSEPALPGAGKSAPGLSFLHQPRTTPRRVSQSRSLPDDLPAPSRSRTPLRKPLDIPAQRRENVHFALEVLYTPGVGWKPGERFEPSVALGATPEVADHLSIQMLSALRCNQFVAALDTAYSEKRVWIKRHRNSVACHCHLIGPVTRRREEFVIAAATHDSLCREH